jgi:nucleoside-triphosphatase
MTRILLLTGRPGVGKTTVIKAVIQTLGERADGFYTEEIRHRGKRRGFRLVGLRGEQGTLAHVRYRERGWPRVGRYGVDVDALERVGVAALERGMAQGRVLIIDEIGKMELFSARFKDIIEKLFKGDSNILATIFYKPHPFCDKLKTYPGVDLITVNKNNRDELVSRIVSLFS